MEKNELLLKDIKSRLSQLESNRDRFIPRWQEAQTYVAPIVYDWHNLDAIPELPKRYTSVPCDYLSILVSGLVGYSISPNLVWFKLSLENQKLLNLYGVKDFLEECEETLLAELNRSNLYSQASPWIQDAATIGHGVMLCDEDLNQGKLRFTTMRSNEIFLDVNEYGEIDTVFRKYLMTLRNAVEFFGKDKLDPQLVADFDDVSKWNNQIEFLYAVYPRQNYDPNKLDSKNKPYAAVYIDLKNNKIVDEGGYDENPFSIFEWDQISGLAYSNSPSIAALPDIKMLNIAKKTSTQIAQTSAEPPMRVSNSIRNISLVPRGFNYISTPDEIIEPIRTGENYPITLEVVQQLKQDIKDWFNVDFFLMLQQQAGNRTATEVMELQGEKAAVLSNLIVALNGALSKIITRSFNLLMRNGKMPDIPQSLKGANTSMKIDFIGPLAQAQKKYHSLGGIAQALSMAQPIMQIFPNASDFIDADELIKHAMEGHGMPQRVIREDDDVQKLREERAMAQAEAQQQAQQQQMMQSLMQNANKLGSAPEDGSPMADMQKQISGSLPY